jgi:flagellar basal body-associated protein FliL
MKKLMVCLGGLLLVLSCSSSGEASPTEREVIVSKSEENSGYLRYSVFINDTAIPLYAGLDKEKIGSEELKSLIKFHIAQFCQSNGLQPVNSKDEATFTITPTFKKIDLRDRSQLWMTLVGGGCGALGIAGSAVNIWKEENPEENWFIYLGTSIISAGQLVFELLDHTFEANVTLDIRLEDKQHTDHVEEKVEELKEEYNESVGYLKILNDALVELLGRPSFDDLCKRMKKMHRKATIGEHEEDLKEDLKKKYNTFQEE